MGSERDRDLVVALARGDRDALEAIYDRHAPALLSLGLRMLGDRGEAQEILHDVFLEAWRRAGDFDPSRGTVRTWLALRMRSRCLDRIKSAGRSRTARAGQDLERHLGAAPPDGPAAVRAARLRAALTELPEAQRSVLLLGYFEGLSGAEIAARLGVPPGTVKSRVHAAMKKLREALDDA